MATNNFKDKGNIIKFGGGVLKLMPVTDAGLPINVITIDGITKADPAVVGAGNTGTLENGDIVLIVGAGGMVEVNDRIFTVANLSADTSFELEGEDSSLHTTFTSGGTAEESNTYDLGYINDSGIRFETESEDIPDETGQTINSVEGIDTVCLEGIFMQSGKNLLDFLRDNTINQYYRVYYKATPTAALNGNTQELFIGIAKLVRMMDVKANTKRCPFEFKILQNLVAITVQEPDVVFSSVRATDVTIAAEEYYHITETA